jgi:hypothetical protein
MRCPVLTSNNSGGHLMLPRLFIPLIVILCVAGYFQYREEIRNPFCGSRIKNRRRRLTKTVVLKDRPRRTRNRALCNRMEE